MDKKRYRDEDERPNKKPKSSDIIMDKNIEASMKVFAEFVKFMNDENFKMVKNS